MGALLYLSKVAIQKVLIIRLSSIGDIVLTSPIVRALKEQQEVDLHFLVRKSFSPLLVHNEVIHKLWLYGNNEALIKRSLKAANFDLVIDLQKNTRSKSICSAIGAKTITFDKKNIAKWFYVNFKYLKKDIPHIVSRYFDAVEKIGIKNDSKGLEFHLDPSIDTPPSLKNKEYYAVALGAAHKTKQIPGSIIKKICEKVNKKVVLLGGKKDSKKGDSIAQLLPMATNYAGSMSIQESAKIISEAKCLLTGDTGLMHIAVGLKIPTVTLWGSTVPEFGMYAYYGAEEFEHSNHQVKNLSCQPCSKLGKKKCPKGHFKCMKDHNIDEIVEKISSFI